MTETATLEVVDETGSGGDPDLVHAVCECNPDVSLCGLDLSDRPFLDDWAEEDECVVCVDLEPQPCPRCNDTGEAA